MNPVTLTSRRCISVGDVVQQVSSDAVSTRSEAVGSHRSTCWMGGYLAGVRHDLHTMAASVLDGSLESGFGISYEARTLVERALH